MECVVLLLVMVMVLTLTTTLTHQNLTTTNQPPYGLEDSPLTEVETLAGSRVLLPCDFEPPVANDSTHLVLFYHGGAGTPIFTVDGRSIGVDKGSQWSEAELEGRASMKLDKGLQGLVLKEVQLRDEGHYRCRVDFYESPTRNFRIQLSVIEPPRSLTVTSDYNPDTEVTHVAGPFPEGAEVTLSCQVLGGHPRPQVSWWHVGSLLDDVSEVMTGQVTRNALSLPPLTRADLNKTLTCQASNSDLVVPLSHTVTVDMTYPPSVVVVLDGSGGGGGEVMEVVEVKEGVAKIVSCEARGARPPATVTWSMDAHKLAHHIRETVTGEVSTSILTLVPEPRHHNLSLTCRAATSTLIHRTISSSIQLKVLYEPRLELVVEPHRDLREVEEGENITFVCHIDSHPPVTGIHWAHNGTPLSTAGGKVQERLVLMEVTMDASGNYTCDAANSEGGRASNTLTLTVKFPPTCAEDQPSEYGAAVHEELHVPCSVLAYPPPSSFRWAVKTTVGVVDVAANLSSSHERRSVVRYTPRTHLDFGDLLCWAVNDLGHQQQPCVFKVVPAAKPESVSGCGDDRNTTLPVSYVLLACTAGWDGGLNQTFTLEVRHAARDKVLEAFSDADKPLFIIKGLKVGVDYLLTVTATNARGSSPPVTIMYTATSAPSNMVVWPPTSTSHTLFDLMSLLCLVAVVVLGGVCVSIALLAIRPTRVHSNKNSPKNMYADSLKEDSNVSDCQKEDNSPGGVTNPYATPSATPQKGDELMPPDSDVILQELASLGRCFTSNTPDSPKTLALNAHTLARSYGYMDAKVFQSNTEYQQALTDFILNNSRCEIHDTEYMSRDDECLPINAMHIPSMNECMSKGIVDSSDVESTNVVWKYPECEGREDMDSVTPLQLESSV